MIVCVPVVSGVYVTGHCPLASSVQLGLLKVPEPSLVKLAVPTGVGPPAVSVTVAMQVVERPNWNKLVLQLTLVLVGPEVAGAVTIVVPPLAACVLSPP